MKKVTAIGLILVAAAAFAPAQPPSFDHLSNEDRAVFRKRFEAEVWPLLTKGGKDGCVGCHSERKNVTSLRMSGDAGKDFAMMLKEGYFLANDDGSLLSRIVDRSAKRRMPPGKRAAWGEDDVKVLRAFVTDMDKKQK